jgi:hypothetical protein
MRATAAAGGCKQRSINIPKRDKATAIGRAINGQGIKRKQVFICTDTFRKCFLIQTIFFNLY